MISNFLWRIVAWIVTRERIADWLINRSANTPYSNILGADGDLYMGRWWIFNPYYETPGLRSWSQDARLPQWLRDLIPSVRIHWIRRPDRDRHLHDHPWNARTIILHGWYSEERLVDQVPKGVSWYPTWNEQGILRAGFDRDLGYTGTLLFGEYHRISAVSPGGVWTLFITWKKRGTWGFRVDGNKVPHGEYADLMGLSQ